MGSTYKVYEKYSKKEVDSLLKVYNNEYGIEKSYNFDLSQAYYEIIKEADRRRLIAEQKERLEKLKAERQAEQAKLKKEKELAEENKWEIYEVTFYTAGYESTQKQKGHPDYGITASGTYVKENQTAACPKELEFGTKIYIEGFGYRICEDRGGAIKNLKLDIYVDSVTKAQKLGRQKLRVKIIKNNK